MVNNRGSSALLAGANYCGALMERLKMGRTASRAHPFRGRLERLQADVERVYAGPTDRPALSVQRHDEHEGLREQYAPPSGTTWAGPSGRRTAWSSP
jgi:predicted aminopeptidase